MPLAPPTEDSEVDASAARLFALVPCAGVGERAGQSAPKQYARLAGCSAVGHTLRALAQVRRLTATLVVLSAGDAMFATHCPEFKGWVARCGGATRASSVGNGLQELMARGARDLDWVLVHDAARCLLRPEWVDRLIDACLDDAVGGLLAMPVADTLKQESAGRVAVTLSRSDKWAAQTPQMFRLGMLRDALAACPAAVTDEASAVEAAGFAPRLVRGSVENIKLTWPEDLELAERLLSAAVSRSPRTRARRPARGTTMTLPAMRVGQGWDTHVLVKDRPLVLGGVVIAHTHGLLGHSDADALCHAITDALFGAASMGDIGRHFPDTDPQFKGADSLALLAEAARRVRAEGWQIGNVDSTVIAQAPRMAPHIAAMRQRLAQALLVEVAQISVKAKTAEGLGEVGRGEAIEASAVCLLIRA